MIAAGQISHATAEAELHANLNGAIAQYTKRTATERSWAAVEIAIEEGRVPWRSTTPGYDLVDGRLVPNALAPVVEQAFRLRAGGTSVQGVREFLANHGIRRSHHGTGTLLCSRVVLGEIHFGSHTPNLRAHPPIVDRGLWLAVQSVRTPRGRRAKSERLLARQGILRCASCGSRMVTATANNSGYPVYRCPPTGECSRRVSISAVAAERVVIEATRTHLEGVIGVRAARQHVRSVRSALKRAEENLAAAIEAIGDWTDPTAVQTLRRLREDRDAAQQRVDDLAVPDEDELLSLAEDWDRLTLADRRRCIRAALAYVEVVPADGRPTEDRLLVESRGFDWRPMPTTLA